MSWLCWYLSLSPFFLPTVFFDRLSTGSGEGDIEQKQLTESENVANETLEEPEKSSKATSEVKKTWGFRRSTVAKREMPVEAATGSPDNRCPVRRSGRQSKRTDKLEIFLSTAKRGSRKSAPPSVESGDPPSQTPTDAETASEASFDGNADTKAEDKVESPERRTRSGARKQPQRKTRGGRQTRGSGRVIVKDEGSSENEDTAKKDQSADKEESKDEKTPEVEGSANTAQPQPEQDSERKEVVVEQKNEHGDENDKEEKEEESDEESDEDSEEKPAAVLVKRGPIRTYVNKKRAANKNSTPVKGPAPANKVTGPVKRETKAAQASGATRQAQGNDDENDSSTSSSSSSSSSSSIDSDEGGYDPNALYCICRQKHNKRYFLSIIGVYLKR